MGWSEALAFHFNSGVIECMEIIEDEQLDSQARIDGQDNRYDTPFVPLPPKSNANASILHPTAS